MKSKSPLQRTTLGEALTDSSGKERLTSLDRGGKTISVCKEGSAEQSSQLHQSPCVSPPQFCSPCSFPINALTLTEETLLRLRI